MIKKKLGLIATSALVVGLVACNNNEGALNTENRVNTVDVADNVNYNGRTSYGPFAREINTRDHVARNDLRTTDRNPDNIDDENYELVTDRYMRNNDPNGMDNISSLTTDLSSEKYPHTKAIAVQDAKFKFIRANSKEDAEKQARQFIEQQTQQAQQRGNQIAQHYRQQAQQGQQNQQAQENQKQAQQQAANQQQAQTKQQANNLQNAQENKATNQQQTKAPAPQQEQAKTPAATDTKKDTQQPAQGVSQAVQQVIDLTNAERRKNGLPDLKADNQLNGVAQKKSEDMRKNNYFSHTSPTYGSPFDMMRDFGVTYKTAGENIAQGQRTPQEVVQAWMNSEGHRKNILSKDFTHIGIGYDSNGHHWTQMFVGR